MSSREEVDRSGVLRWSADWLITDYRCLSALLDPWGTPEDTKEEQGKGINIPVQCGENHGCCFRSGLGRCDDWPPLPMSKEEGWFGWGQVPVRVGLDYRNMMVQKLFIIAINKLAPEAWLILVTASRRRDGEQVPSPVGMITDHQSTHHPTGSGNCIFQDFHLLVTTGHRSD